jgi:hypothetical protein
MIDRPEDLTPDGLLEEASSLEYTGRAHAAEIMRWAAERIRQLEAFEKMYQNEAAQAAFRAGPRRRR